MRAMDGREITRRAMRGRPSEEMRQGDAFTTNELASESGMGRRTYERRHAIGRGIAAQTAEVLVETRLWFRRSQHILDPNPANVALQRGRQMPGRGSADAQLRMEGVVASCEGILEDIADELRTRSAERGDALRFFTQTKAERESLETQEHQLIERLLGPAPQYDAVAIFFSTEAQRALDERREKLESARNTNEELRALTQGSPTPDCESRPRGRIWPRRISTWSMSVPSSGRWCPSYARTPSLR